MSNVKRPAEPRTYGHSADRRMWRDHYRAAVCTLWLISEPINLQLDWRNKRLLFFKKLKSRRLRTCVRVCERKRWCVSLKGSLSAETISRTFQGGVMETGQVRWPVPTRRLLVVSERKDASERMYQYENVCFTLTPVETGFPRSRTNMQVDSGSSAHRGRGK